MGFTITSGALPHGIKVVISGVEGVGKTTLAAQFPDPLFIDTEGSTAHYDFIKRLPVPENWADVAEMVEWVGKEKPCQTLVIDSFDWAEKTQIESMKKAKKWESIATPDYSKGWILSAEEIAKFLRLLETKLINAGINVVLILHVTTVRTKAPEEGLEFDRYEIKLGGGTKSSSRSVSLVKEWADILLFCNFPLIVEGEGKRGTATGGTERVMHATHSAIWDAKNRFGLPADMPMSFDPLKPIFEKRANQMIKQASPEVNRREANVDPDSAPQTENKQDPKPNNKWFEQDQPIYCGFPDEVPQYVKDFCIKKEIHPDEVQELLFETKIAENNAYPLEKVPEKFWISFVNEFDTRWAEAYEKAKPNALPF